MNKKANLGVFGSLFVWIVTIIGLAFAFGAIIYVINVGTENFRDVAATMDTKEVNASQYMEATIGMVSPALESLKWISVMIIVGSILAVWIGNVMVRVHPLFAVPYILLMLLAVVISAPLSNTYEELLTENVVYSTTLQGFTGMNYIILNLPVWVTIIGVIGGILMFINIGDRKNNLGFA